MKRNFCSSICLFAALFLAHVGDAGAADYRVMVGEKDSLTSLTTGDRIVASLESKRSYCFTVVSSDLNDNARFTSGAVKVSSGVEDNTFPRAEFNGRLAPVIPVSATNPAPQNTRYCFAPASSADYAIPLSFSVGTSGATKAFCEETTLVGGYNLVATDFAYLEVSNQLNPASSAEKGIWYSAFSSRDEAIVLEFEGGGRFDHPIHEFAAARTFATLFLVHSGPPNSLAAQVSQYAVIAESVHVHSGDADAAAIAGRVKAMACI